MEITTVNLEQFYESLKGVIKPPLQQPYEVEEEPFVLVAVKETCYWLATALGWDFKGEIPDHIKKAVIIIAPHTSMWDMFYGMAAYRHLKNVRGNYLAKKELFKGPLRYIFEKTGGIPVDRTKSNDLVYQVSRLFTSKSSFFLALAPEGTRSKTKKWKSGFYRMAVEADVPIVMAYLDFKKKEGGVGEILYPSGDYKADAKKIEAFYKNVNAHDNKKWNWRVF